MPDMNDISKVTISIEKDKDGCYVGDMYVESETYPKRTVHGRETLGELLIALAFQLTNDYKEDD